MARRNLDSSASLSSVMTPSYFCPSITQVGYARTGTVSQRSRREFIPLGSHSMYGNSDAADPNRAFCSLHAGHQNAP